MYFIIQEMEWLILNVDVYFLKRLRICRLEKE